MGYIRAIFAFLGPLFSIVDKFVPRREESQTDILRKQGEQERAELDRMRQDYLRRKYSGD